MSTPTPWPKLRSLGFLARLGVAFALLSLIWGTLGAGFFLYLSKENRDESPGLTINDIKAHYHGITSPSALLAALERGHPEDLPEADRTALTNWLTGDNIEGNYDNFDLGDAMPEDLIYVNCISCHSNQARGTPEFAEPLLDTPSAVLSLSVSRDVQPVDLKVLAASTHTHALALATLMAAFAIIACMTSWPRKLVGLVIAATSVGLFADLISWWIMRLDVAGVEHAAWATAIGGGTFNTGIILLSLMILLDLCLPAKKSPAPAQDA